jgi:hypothetical protein
MPTNGSVMRSSASYTSRAEISIRRISTSKRDAQQRILHEPSRDFDPPNFNKASVMRSSASYKTGAGFSRAS